MMGAFFALLIGLLCLVAAVVEVSAAPHRPEDARTAGWLASLGALLIFLGVASL